MIQYRHEIFENAGAFYATENEEIIGELTYFFTTAESHILIANHTWITPAKRGLGIGDLLVEKLIEYTHKKELKINPTCSFIVYYFKKHLTDLDVLATEL